MIKELKEPICVCTGYKKKSHTFDTYEELLKWTQEQIEENKIEIGDLVEVVDTGECYPQLDDKEILTYYFATVEIEDFIDIVNHFNHKSLGYSNGIHSIDKKSCVFKVIGKINSKYVIEAEGGEDFIDYMEGYYIIGEKGVKKCQEI
jgi:hypothetical protein